MKITNIASSISSAFNSSTNAVCNAAAVTADWASEAGSTAATWLVEVGESVWKGMVFTAEMAAVVMLEIGKIMWWLVTLPFNIVLSIIFYITLYIVGKGLQKAMEETEEQRFASALCVN